MKTWEEEYKEKFTGLAWHTNPIEGKLLAFIRTKIEEAKKEVEERIKSRVGNLRMWLNEKQSGAVTNEDILYFLGLASSEEVKESHEKEKRLRDILFLR